MFLTFPMLVIGVIVFAILLIVNFVVITKGSGRIAEVSARFSLDAMPGKQMAIDADLSAGLIDEKEARRRRKDLEDESAFFGSMDGAAKFVRGDAIAGLLITFIELIKNPRYNFWQHGFTRCATEIERVFESVARSCMGQQQQGASGQPGAARAEEPGAGASA